MADVKKLSLLQTRIKVAVDFYDASEERELLQYPTAERIKHVVEHGLEIPTEQFLTYYLFHRKRPGKYGWRNYREVGRHIGRAISWLDEWVDFNGESISTPPDVEFQDRAITERIGESIGLSVVSEIHKLTAADWDRIPERPGPLGVPTFDYRVASDGNNIIQTETKGASIRDSNDRRGSIRTHRRSIRAKKTSIAASQRLNQYPFPANLRYGTIAVISSNPHVPVKCLLLDPPAEGNPQLSERFRVLLRARFLRDWITFISPRSQLAAALQTRLLDLESVPDPFVFDGRPLLRGSGERFDFLPFGGWPGHSSFFARKSKITDSRDGGVVVPAPNGDLFFLGLRQSVIDIAAAQELRQLSQFRTETGPVEKTIRVVLTESQFRTLGLAVTIRERGELYGRYIEFDLTGTIHYSDSGTLYGVLPTREE